MKQSRCPWCGMGFRGDQSDSWHVEGFREEGRCGSQWFPDFEGGHTQGRKQSEACREIVRLKIAHLRRMIGSIRLVLDRHLISAETEAEYERKKWRRNDRAGRFAKACLAKITELKESQCLTKS